MKFSVGIWWRVKVIQASANFTFMIPIRLRRLLNSPSGWKIMKNNENSFTRFYVIWKQHMRILRSAAAMISRRTQPMISILEWTKSCSDEMKNSNEAAGKFKSVFIAFRHASNNLQQRLMKFELCKARFFSYSSRLQTIIDATREFLLARLNHNRIDIIIAMCVILFPQLRQRALIKAPFEEILTECRASSVRSSESKLRMRRRNWDQRISGSEFITLIQLVTITIVTCEPSRITKWAFCTTCSISLLHQRHFLTFQKNTCQPPFCVWRFTFKSSLKQLESALNGVA